MLTRRTSLKYDIVRIVKAELKSNKEHALGGRWKQLEIAGRIANHILALEYFDDLRVE